MSYMVEVKEGNDGELYIELPDELLEETGWKEGTDVCWSVRSDGTIILKKDK